MQQEFTAETRIYEPTPSLQILSSRRVIFVKIINERGKKEELLEKEVGTNGK